MNSPIKKFDENKEYYFQEGCYIVEVSNSEEDPDVSIVRARVEPSQSTRWHHLVDTTERYVVLEGTGLVEIGDGEATEVMVGDVVIIPSNTRQRITNTGNGDLKFLAICTPRFDPGNYRQD